MIGSGSYKLQITGTFCDKSFVYSHLAVGVRLSGFMVNILPVVHSSPGQVAQQTKRIKISETENNSSVNGEEKTCYKGVNSRESATVPPQHMYILGNFFFFNNSFG